MGRHPGPPTTQIAIRIEDELLEQVDALVPLLKTAWSIPNRSDVIRACIVAGLPLVKLQSSAAQRAAAHELQQIQAGRLVYEAAQARLAAASTPEEIAKAKAELAAVSSITLEREPPKPARRRKPR